MLKLLDSDASALAYRNLDIWNKSILTTLDKEQEDTVNNYICPLCYRWTVKKPRATIVHGCQSWYNEDCYNCCRLEDLRLTMGIK